MIHLSNSTFGAFKPATLTWPIQFSGTQVEAVAENPFGRFANPFDLGDLLVFREETLGRMLWSVGSQLTIEDLADALGAASPMYKRMSCALSRRNTCLCFVKECAVPALRKTDRKRANACLIISSGI